MDLMQTHSTSCSMIRNKSEKRERKGLGYQTKYKAQTKCMQHTSLVRRSAPRAAVPARVHPMESAKIKIEINRFNVDEAIMVESNE